MNLQDIQLVPDPERIIEGLRDTGYEFKTAIADLIDNSITANATTIKINVVLDMKNNIQCSVIDNGLGMTRDELISAMKYGASSKNKSGGLGKYGLGLKTASTAFCRKLSVVSRSAKDLTPNEAIWDLDHIRNSHDWLLQVPDFPNEQSLLFLNEISPRSSGTVVQWQNIDRLIRNTKNSEYKAISKVLDQKIKQLNDHIAMTFQRFLDKSDTRAPNIEIFLNSKEISFWDPFQKEYSEIAADEKHKVDEVNAEIHAIAYILPRREEFPDSDIAKAAKISTTFQGLYLYRNNRLIHYADWLGIVDKEPHSSLLRVECSFDQNLDEVLDLDLKKSRVLLNDDIVDWFKNEFIQSPRREANKRYRKGDANKVANKSDNAHEFSNNSIKNKESEIQVPQISSLNPDEQKVTLINSRGTHLNYPLTIMPAEKSNDVRVIPADGLTDGLLFEPTLIGSTHAVQINVQHPYYHKVYVPNLVDTVLIQGMDSLFWALCVGELSSTTDKISENFRDMRFQVSYILRKLIEDLPEPKKI